jgi:surfactin synthase thioesterase subunit
MLTSTIQRSGDAALRRWRVEGTPTLECLPAAGGSSMSFAAMAARLADRWPICAIDAAGLAGRCERGVVGVVLCGLAPPAALAHAEPWASTHEVEGDHFFVQSDPAGVAALVAWFVARLDADRREGSAL